jgi:hypothetical protein
MTACKHKDIMYIKTKSRSSWASHHHHDLGGHGHDHPMPSQTKEMMAGAACMIIREIMMSQALMWFPPWSSA